MKNRILPLIFFTIVTLSVYAQTYTVEFEIKNVRNDKGLVSGALFSGEENFPDKDKARFSASVTAKAGKVILRFTEIPPGEYAFAVFHDENSNHDMDTNFAGFPKEGYAFSNNIHPRLRAPKYRDVKFRVSGDYYGSVSLIY